MIWNYDHLKKQNIEFGKICTFKKKIIQKELTQVM
jgi:hypothetical protein